MDRISDPQLQVTENYVLLEGMIAMMIAGAMIQGRFEVFYPRNLLQRVGFIGPKYTPILSKIKRYRS